MSTLLILVRNTVRGMCVIVKTNFPVLPLQCISCDSNSVTGMQAPAVLLKLTQPVERRQIRQPNPVGGESNVNVIHILLRRRILMKQL